MEMASSFLGMFQHKGDERVDARIRRKKTLTAMVACGLTGILGSAAAYADVTCNETVTMIYMHSNGNVYFTTSSTCSSWCEISFGTAAANNQAYAMLLSANAQGKTLYFDWPNLTSCSSQNQTYAIPGWVGLPD
jgi:hypothetical protein